MKEFAKSLLTNRFGLILGILNLCCIPLYGLFSFSSKTSIFLESCFVGANSPVIISSRLLGLIVGTIFPIFRTYTMEILLVPVFILVQWIFIGYFSKVIAQRINRNSN